MGCGDAPAAARVRIAARLEDAARTPAKRRRPCAPVGLLPEVTGGLRGGELRRVRMAATGACGTALTGPLVLKERWKLAGATAVARLAIRRCPLADAMPLLLLPPDRACGGVSAVTFDDVRSLSRW